ncbi:MAG TPA: DUF6438 domain-containing protein [Kofleriaceae bacterium]
MITLVLLASALAACVHTRTPSSFVRMERTECLGRCPVYTVTLYEDGAVWYRGEENVPRGTEWRTVAPAEVERLARAAERVPAWQCAADRIVTDHPSAIVTVSRGHLTRRLVHDHGDPCAPFEMFLLEADIDRAARTARHATP